MASHLLDIRSLLVIVAIEMAAFLQLISGLTLANEEITKAQNPNGVLKTSTLPLLLRSSLLPTEKSPITATKTQLLMGLGMGFGFTFGLIIVTIILWKVCCGLMASRMNPRNAITPRNDEEAADNAASKEVDFSNFDVES